LEGENRIHNPKFPLALFQFSISFSPPSNRFISFLYFTFFCRRKVTFHCRLSKQTQCTTVAKAYANFHRSFHSTTITNEFTQSVDSKYTGVVSFYMLAGNVTKREQNKREKTTNKKNIYNTVRDTCFCLQHGNGTFRDDDLNQNV